MATPYEDLCDALETDLEGLTPPELTGTTYTRIEDEVEDWGLTADRCFFFEWGGTNIQSSQGVVRFDLRERFNIVVNVKGARKNVKTWDFGLRNEAILMMNKINSRPSWPVGIHGVTCEDIDIRRAPNEVDAQIVLECRFLSFNIPPP